MCSLCKLQKLISLKSDSDNNIYLYNEYYSTELLNPLLNAIHYLKINIIKEILEKIFALLYLL